MLLRGLTAIVVVAITGAAVFAMLNYFQGFETDASGWVMDLGPSGIQRVPSGGGTLHLPASAGHYYAEIQNLHDGYSTNIGCCPGYGEAGYSFFGGADPVYHGDFFQAIDVYLDANWTPAALSYSQSFWIDMTPYHADPNNYGAEHNFRLTATGASVAVSVDGEPVFATITTSGWYTFMMTWRKDTNPANPVITDMNIFDASHQLYATTQVFATAPGGPFLSADLRGNGYVWFTVWQNNFGNDVLGIDNQRTGLLPLTVATTKDQCKGSGWQSVKAADFSPFKNQGDCIQYVNTGK
jgi:hypothetical protein